MRDFPFSRLFRALICFVLICCMFFSYAAIPSRAFGFAEVAIPAMALIYLYLIMQTGFIPPPDITISNLENVDQSFRNWYGDFDISFRNPDDPWPDDLDDEESDLSEQAEKIVEAMNNGADADAVQAMKISDELLTAFKLFAAFCIGENVIPLPGEEAAPGYAYYNGLYLPVINDLSDSYPYALIVCNTSTGGYRLYVSDNPFRCKNDIFVSSKGFTVNYYDGKLESDGTAWDLSSSPASVSTSRYIATEVEFIWANYDVYDHDDLSSIVLSASTPLTQEEAYLEAAAILGETAQGIQDGTKTEDDIVIPQYVNVSELFANVSNADDLMQNFNQIAQELQDGTREYNEFAQSVVATNPGTGDNVGDNTGSDTGVEDGTGTTTEGDSWEAPEDPGKFALDLKNYFPFCIPFDLYAFLACLNADPVTPVIQWELALPGGGSYPIEIDLSPFDPVAQVLRRLQLLLFIVGLAIKTRDLIKG